MWSRRDADRAARVALAMQNTYGWLCAMRAWRRRREWTMQTIAARASRLVHWRSYADGGAADCAQADITMRIFPRRGVSQSRVAIDSDNHLFATLT